MESVWRMLGRRKTNFYLNWYVTTVIQYNSFKWRYIAGAGAKIKVQRRSRSRKLISLAPQHCLRTVEWFFYVKEK